MRLVKLGLSSGDSSTMLCKESAWPVVVLRRLIAAQPTNTPIYTLSLSNNILHDLHQLSRLPHSLPHLRALDLSNNPIRKISELDELLAEGEKKGKATAGVGSLKSLTELKLNGCLFREQMLQQAKGAEIYQQ